MLFKNQDTQQNKVGAIVQSTRPIDEILSSVSFAVHVVELLADVSKYPAHVLTPDELRFRVSCVIALKRT